MCVGCWISLICWASSLDLGMDVPIRRIVISIASTKDTMMSNTQSFMACKKNETSCKDVICVHNFD